LDPVARKDKKGKKPAGAARLAALFESGDWRAAAAEARRLLDNPASGEAERALAREAQGRLAPEPGALWVGILGLALVTAVIALGLWR
jgi:anti-sigma factor RsiW